MGGEESKIEERQVPGFNPNVKPAVGVKGKVTTHAARPSPKAPSVGRYSANGKNLPATLFVFLGCSKQRQ